MPDGHWHHTVGCCTHGQIQEVVWQWLFLVKGHSTVSRVRVAQIVSPVFFRGEPRATETLDKAALKTCAGIRAEDLYYVSFTNG